MILKYGIGNENDSTVEIHTLDNISRIVENEPHENDSKTKERLINFIRPTYAGSPEECISLNIDWNASIVFAYLMNDAGKTFKVLKHDTRDKYMASCEKNE